MKIASKILALLLTAALALTTGLAAEADHAPAPSGPLAGCHAHSGKIPHSQRPLPGPVNYQCCLTGHDAAAVKALHVPQPSALGVRLALRVKPASRLSLVSDLKVPMVFSADPPGSPPLRI
jgi:hypothetical protein